MNIHSQNLILMTLLIMASENLMAMKGASASTSSKPKVERGANKPVSSAPTAPTGPTLAQRAYNAPGQAAKAVGLHSTGQFITGQTGSLASATGYTTTANTSGSWYLSNNAVVNAPGQAAKALGLHSTGQFISGQTGSLRSAKAAVGDRLVNLSQSKTAQQTTTLNPDGSRTLTYRDTTGSNIGDKTQKIAAPRSFSQNVSAAAKAVYNAPGDAVHFLSGKTHDGSIMTGTQGSLMSAGRSAASALINSPGRITQGRTLSQTASNMANNAASRVFSKGNEKFTITNPETGTTSVITLTSEGKPLTEKTISKDGKSFTEINTKEGSALNSKIIAERTSAGYEITHNYNSTTGIRLTSVEVRPNTNSPLNPFNNKTTITTIYGQNGQPQTVKTLNSSGKLISTKTYTKEGTESYFIKDSTGKIIEYRSEVTGHQLQNPVYGLSKSHLPEGTTIKVFETKNAKEQVTERTIEKTSREISDSSHILLKSGEIIREIPAKIIGKRTETEVFNRKSEKDNSSTTVIKDTAKPELTTTIAKNSAGRQASTKIANESTSSITEINHLQNTASITTASGQKTSYTADGRYKVEVGGKVVAQGTVAPASNRTMVEKATGRNKTEPLQMEINPDGTVSHFKMEGKNKVEVSRTEVTRSGLKITETQIGREPLIREISGKGESRTSQILKNPDGQTIGIAESFNNGPIIVTSRNAEGQATSTIPNGNGTTTQVVQTGYSLSILNSGKAGLLGTKPKAVELRFENFAKRLETATPEQAKKIIDQMTLELTGSKNVISSKVVDSTILQSREYLSFRESMLTKLLEVREQQAKMNAPQAAASSMMSWFTSFFKQTMSLSATQSSAVTSTGKTAIRTAVTNLISTKPVVEMTAQTVNKKTGAVEITLKNSDTQVVTQVSSKSEAVINTVQGGGQAAYQPESGRFVTKNSSGKFEVIDIFTGSVKSAGEIVPNLAPGKGKQTVIPSEKPGDVTTITFAENGVTPVTVSVRTLDGSIKIYAATNGILPPKLKEANPIAEMINYGDGPVSVTVYTATGNTSRTVGQTVKTPVKAMVLSPINIL